MIQFKENRQMNVLSVEDMDYLAQQSSGRINMILSGMTALMNDTDNKVELMESQNWFQRMVKTVTGKNKLTQAEIQQNHDKLNAYMSEAIAELYNRNCIDHEIIISLGIQLNELYADHLQLKQMLGAFVNKLNEKIESVDNFHLLVEEISQGMYDHQYPIVTVVYILSMMDKRMLADERKCAIITRTLRNKNILNHDPFSLITCMEQVMSLNEADAGRFYLELMTIKENYFVSMLLTLMNEIYFIDLAKQKFVHKRREIRNLLKIEDYSENSILSTEDIFDEFLTAKKDVIKGLLPISVVQVDEKLSEAEALYFNCRLDEAFELFRTLAEKGNARAMYFLGEYYVQPYGHVAKDNEEGKRWRKKGYELGDVLSALNMAYSLPKKSEERSDIFAQMFEPTLRLAESGDVYAQNELSDLYLNGYGTAQNEKEGYRWLKKSAETGFWRSIDKIGDFYYKGQLVEQDYNAAIQWYQKGMDKGYARSYLNMAYCYYYGNGVSEDNSKALELFTKSYELGCGEAANMVGVMYNKGYGVPIDNEQEFLWLKRSAETGYVQGQSNLGNCYYWGRGIAKDYNSAKKWYQLASDEGNNYATTQLGIIAMEDNDYSQAVEWFRIAAENGYADAQNRLGVRYDIGQGVEEDKSEAFKWFMKAAEQGHMKAQSNVGNCYYYGHGIAANDEKAKEWLRKSADQGYDVAKENLYEWYGEGDEEENATSNDSHTISSDTYDNIKTACEVHILMHDGSNYDVSYNLKDTLGILYEEVYLAHDDTLFKNGKNGFAITKYGIYCREFMASLTNYTTFEELAQADNIYINGSNIYADGNMIAYFSGSNSEREDLKSLFYQIAFFVRLDLM